MQRAAEASKAEVAERQVLQAGLVARAEAAEAELCNVREATAAALNQALADANAVGTQQLQVCCHTPWPAAAHWQLCIGSADG